MTRDNGSNKNGCDLSDMPAPLRRADKISEL